MKDTQRPLLTPSQVAEVAGCSRQTVINYINYGWIGCFFESNGNRRLSLETAQYLRQLLAERRLARGIPPRPTNQGEVREVRDG